MSRDNDKENDQDASQLRRTTLVSNEEVLQELRALAGTVAQIAPARAASVKKKAANQVKSVPGHDELRDRFLAMQTDSPLVHSRLRFYVYSNGIWEEAEEGMIENSILITIESAKGENVRVTSGLLRSVLKLTEVKLAMRGADFDARPDLLVCGNGTLDLRTRKLLAHSPEHFATSRVTYDYSVDAVSPAWDRYLLYVSKVLGQDVVSFLQEFIGYALTTDTSHEIMVWLCGAKGSGKSTFIDGVTAALSDRRGNFSLKCLGAKFGLIHIPGKTLLTSTENTSTASLAANEGILSQIVSGESVKIEHKGRDMFDCNPVAKILWAMNRLPAMPDSESGFWRRVKVVKFPKMPNEIEIDTGLKQRIQGEGAGILNWALDGLDRLTARGRFLVPKSISGATSEYQASCDIIGMFVTECLQIGPNLQVGRADLYRAFKTWCNENSLKPLTAPDANAAFEQKFGEPKVIRGNWFWTGCDLGSMLVDPVVSDY